MSEAHPDLLDAALRPSGANKGRELAIIATEDSRKPNENGAKFDWLSDDSVVLQPQLAIAIYRNEAGGLVIRQEQNWNEDDDIFIVVSADNIDNFVDKLTDVAGIPSLGGPQPAPVTKRGAR